MSNDPFQQIAAQLRQHNMTQKANVIKTGFGITDFMFKAKGAEVAKPVDKSRKAPEGKSKRMGLEDDVPPVTQHEKAQLLFIKNNMKEDPCKCYEIYQSMSIQAQHILPQSITAKLVADHHKQAKINEENEKKEEAKQLALKNKVNVKSK